MNSSITNYLLPNKTKYKLFEEIGSGAYGVVYKGLREDDGQNVALKRIFVTDKDGNNNIPLSTHRELSALKRLNKNDNKNIVRLYDVVLNKIEGKICMDLIFELGDYDLERYLKDYNSSGEMPLSKIINLSKQLFGAIHYMHSLCVIHRDLKPANILINKEGTELKVTDFGLARILGFDTSLTPVVVTLWYRSPEILLQRSYMTPSDVWSVGCIIAEMIYSRPIFAGENEISQIEKIVKRLGFEAINNWPQDNIIDRTGFINLIDKTRSLDSILKRADKSFIKMIKNVLRFDPDSRILAAEALSDLDTIENVYAKTSCINCSVSSLSGFRCNGVDCDMDPQNEMIVNSVVRNVLDDDFALYQNSMLSDVTNITKDVVVTSSSNEKFDIDHLCDSTFSSPIEDHVSSNSCSETDTCDELIPAKIEPEPLANKDSDEVGDSFSSYRSQNNCSFSSYAPSPPTGLDSTDDDEVACVDKDIDDFKQFKENFIISDEPTMSTLPLESDKEELTDSDIENQSTSQTLEKNNSTPFKELNDRSRLISPNHIQRKESYLRKRNLNSDGTSESENETTHFSPISFTTDISKTHLTRHKSLRRRVSMQGPHIQGEKSLKIPLVRTGSVFIPTISENEECRDLNFGKRKLTPILNTVQSSKLSDRPKIVGRRRSYAKKM